jgi:hypothetical protein
MNQQRKPFVDEETELGLIDDAYFGLTELRSVLVSEIRLASALRDLPQGYLDFRYQSNLTFGRPSQRVRLVSHAFRHSLRLRSGLPNEYPSLSDEWQHVRRKLAEYLRLVSGPPNHFLDGARSHDIDRNEVITAWERHLADLAMLAERLRNDVAEVRAHSISR